MIDIYQYFIEYMRNMGITPDTLLLLMFFYRLQSMLEKMKLLERQVNDHEKRLRQAEKHFFMRGGSNEQRTQQQRTIH